MRTLWIVFALAAAALGQAQEPPAAPALNDKTYWFGNTWSYAGGPR